MVGAQAVVGIHKYYMIVKYEFKGYSDQAELPDEHQILMYDYFEALYGDIVLKFNKFLEEEGGDESLSMVPKNSSMYFLTLLVREMDQIGRKLLLILAWVEPTTFLTPIKPNGYLMASWQAWYGDF